MRTRRVLWGVLVVALSIPGLVADGSAATYKYRYVDAKGEAHFADKAELVPEQHRSSAMLVSVEEVDEKAQAAVEEERTRTAGTVAAAKAAEVRAAQEQVPDRGTIEPPRKANLLWSGVAVLSVFVVMTLLGWVDALREQEHILNGIRTALFVLLAAYLAMAHGMDVLGLFSRVGSTVSTLEQQSAERGKKAAQFYKSLEDMMDQAAQAQKDQEAQMKDIPEHR